MATTDTYRAFGITFAGELAEEVRRIAKRWWLIALLGLATVVPAILLLANLATAIGVLTVLVAIALLVEGVDDIVMAGRHRVRWPSYVIGALWIIVGIVALVWPGITLLALAVVVGVGFVVAGIGQIGAALTWRRGLPMWGLWLTLGILTLLIGVIALVWPGLTILTLAIWLGIGLLLRGLGTLWFSLQLRKAAVSR
ncbi:HdeD family acid-resistance protein [Prauserella flavalba]|uniref:HdeD family acid-resistance protein n=1 Tax=Prauserella flavalba TaxID=1477506 RepID=UPI0036F18280